MSGIQFLFENCPNPSDRCVVVVKPASRRRDRRPLLSHARRRSARCRKPVRLRGTPQNGSELVRIPGECDGDDDGEDDVRVHVRGRQMLPNDTVLHSRADVDHQRTNELLAEGISTSTRGRPDASTHAKVRLVRYEKILFISSSIILCWLMVPVVLVIVVHLAYLVPDYFGLHSQLALFDFDARFPSISFRNRTMLSWL